MEACESTNRKKWRIFVFEINVFVKKQSDMGPSIKYVTLFLTPLPLSHFVTHPGTPPKVRHTSRTSPPIYSRPSTIIPDKSPRTNSISIVRGGFCPGGLSGLVFVRSPFCHNTFCYNRKLTIINFMFHMYDKNLFKRDVTCS